MQLAPLFRDHAVLQREISLPVWGRTGSGEEVHAELAGQVARVVADAEGRWLLRFAPLPAGGPHELRVSGPSGSVTVRDLLIGDVWICSGQSNMEWQLAKTGLGLAELGEGVDLQRLRLLTVATPAQLGRQQRIAGSWRTCDVHSVADFSAVGAWFGRRLLHELDVPVGLICNAWGGTRVQAWMSREALMEDPLGRDELRHYEGYLYAWDRFEADEFASVVDWERRGAPQDAGNRGLAEGWAEAEDLSDWESMAVPGNWQAHGHPGSGVFWFRRSVELPAAWRGRELVLHLGAIDKHDDSYVNGTRVGGLSWEAGPQSWCTPREYLVPAGVIAADGRMTIAVRVRSHMHHGGLIGPETAMRVHPVDDDSAPLPLAGDWRYRIEQDWGVVVPPTPPWGPGNPNSPGILFDSRIAPLLPYAIRGAIWYQGESNVGQAADYARMLSAMIHDWRRAWGQGGFPVIQVQLANYQQPATEPKASAWAELRDAQARVARSTSATFCAVAIDVGEAADIHPRDKRAVGERLARIALAEVHARDLVPTGPVLRTATVEVGGRMRCRFDHARGLRTRDGGPPQQVAIAGQNRRFVWAETAIEGESLVAWHPQVPRPAALRYAWADNPEGCNLVNAEGLPAAPFRTDAW